MDDFQRLQQKAAFIVFFSMFAVVGGTAGVGLLGYFVLDLAEVELLMFTAAGAFLLVLLITRLVTRYILSPFHALWQAILHVVPESTSVPAPNMNKVHFGRQLVTSLAARVYQFASHEDGVDLAEHRQAILQAVNIVSHFPLPVFVFNKQLVITNASDSALQYLSLESPELFGHRLFDSVKLEFPSERTLDVWIKDCQENKVTDNAYWQRVRVLLRDGTVKQCDIAAYYNRNNQSGTEFIITLFDHTELYNQDDESLSFVALAVHEFRTPLTGLRGYIEALEEDLAGKLGPEQAAYLQKLRLSSEQLAAFVDNILNVVKVEQNQLSVPLIGTNWEQTLRRSAQAMERHAHTMDKTITFKIDPDLPVVAIDPVSISLVVNNLLDNALKYSRDAKEVIVSTRLNQDGMIETTIQDFGIGIPENVLPNLFEKFYRNHRTRNQIGGTGLGLYLCKAIISAHGGHIWVQSKVGQGSSLTFTLQPYAQLADDLKSGNQEITRQAHGWIKNHSLYRR